jgi:N-acetylglucosamine malate deacetylase 1
MADVLRSYEGQSVLCIGAHPDDIEIGMGGIAAQLARAGARVTIAAVVVPDNLEERILEAGRAAKLLGAERFEVLERERPRRVEDLNMYELVARLDALVRKYEPAALFTHSTAEVHHDHILTHRAVLSSLRLRPMDLYFYGPSTCKPTIHQWQPRIWVDIAETIDAKLEAIAAHESQFGRRGICVNGFRDQARALGAPVGLAYAEGLDLLCMRT